MDISGWHLINACTINSNSFAVNYRTLVEQKLFDHFICLNWSCLIICFGVPSTCSTCDYTVEVVMSDHEVCYVIYYIA